MPAPANYTYRQGGWYAPDGTGPYGFAVGSSVPVPLFSVGAQRVNTQQSNAQHGGFNRAGEGPFFLRN